MERLRADPPPKGPIPLLPTPAEARQARLAAAEGNGASQAGASRDSGIDMTVGLPPGSTLIGKPGPYDRRYAIGYDHVGAQIQGFDPVLSRDDKPSTEGRGSS